MEAGWDVVAIARRKAPLSDYRSLDNSFRRLHVGRRRQGVWRNGPCGALVVRPLIIGGIRLYQLTLSGLFFRGVCVTFQRAPSTRSMGCIEAWRNARVVVGRTTHRTMQAHGNGRL